MRQLFLIGCLCMASSAQAFVCRFQTECYEAEACGAADYLIDVQLQNQSVSTADGDWVIVAKKSEAALITLFAAAKGVEYLVSITPEAARLSGHLNAGPRAIQYLGTCEGAF
ncbi:hypothetical protein [uncultured Lentibacter sp.]|uniref:hypothetical protein n=1 Tax=uncultured Lentibacter sp. TaxID=1659309 RepID=UPI00260BB66E|nr:hypothetical protein [uncultured Lentibacter sp.]MCW1955377.1 hypothetical protein [Roseobacter sp.]